MMNRWLRKTRLALLSLAALALIGCGGSGGGTGSGGFLGGNDGNQIDAVISMEVTNTLGEADNQLSAANPLTVTVALTRGNGDPIPDVVVDLATSVGSISPDNGSALTNENGEATFGLAFDGTEGAGTLTASYTENEQTVEVELGIQAVIADTASVYLLELTTTDSDGNLTKRFSSFSPLTITVALYGVEGDVLTPLVDELVALESSIGILDPSNGSSLTDENGQAQFTLTADNEVGAGVITASFTNDTDDIFSRSQNIEVRLDQGENAPFTFDLQLLDSAGNSTSQLTPEEPVTARASLTTTLENASVEARLITLSSTIANVSPANGSTLTDENGIAEFLLEYGGTSGAGTVTASFATDNASLIKTALLEATSLALESDLSILILDSAGNASNVLTNESPLTVRVTITDRDGNSIDIDDALIELSSDIGKISPANGQALTDDGVAEFTLQFDGTVGAGVVTAVYSTEQGTVEQTANIEAQTDGESVYVISMTRSSGSVTPINPVTVTVNLRSGEAGGPVVAGEVITLTSTISDVSPSNGAVITDVDGNATFILEYNGTDGAGAVEASFTSAEGNTFSNSINVTASRGAPLYTINITAPQSGASFDETGVDVTVNVQSTQATQRALIVSLTSEVGIVSPQNGKALTNSLGNANFRLTGDGGTGAGLLTATFTDQDGNEYQDAIAVNMGSSGVGGGGGEASKIVFVSATPTTIALKGSGGGTGISEQAAVVFKVTDSTDIGIGGQDVSFSLSTDLGGIDLQNTTGTSDAQGNVTAIVNSGTLPTPVRVEATTVVPQLGEIFALSPVLNVSSGVPVDSRFNIFYTAPQDECGDLAGITCTQLLVTAFDRFGNPAVDGTVVNFVSNCGGVGSNEGGISSGACVLGSAGFGRCEVVWLAGDMNPNDYSQCADGSPVEVLAYTLGEENFTDANGNAYFDATAISPVPPSPPSRGRESSIENNGEPYVDENGSDAYEVGEFFIDWNNNGGRDAVTTSSDDLTARPGPYPKPGGSPVEDDDDLLPYNYIFYNGTACAERLDENGDPVAGSPNLADDSDGNPIIADVDDCSPELIYVWDTIDPTF